MAFKSREAYRTYHRKWRKENQAKVKAAYQKYDRTHPGRRLDARRKSRYGVTPVAFQRMYDEQDGACAICRTPEAECQDGRLVIDHNHATDAVRALLCHPCNRALGAVEDNEAVVAAMLAYLLKHKEGK